MYWPLLTKTQELHRLLIKCLDLLKSHCQKTKNSILPLNNSVGPSVQVFMSRTILSAINALKKKDYKKIHFTKSCFSFETSEYKVLIS